MAAKWRWLFAALGKNCAEIVKGRKAGVGATWEIFSVAPIVHAAAMHEVSIITEAVRLAEDAARSAGARRITQLRLRVGALSGVVPEALTFAWDIVRQNTLAAEASLEIETVGAHGWCAACESEFPAREFVSECPRCQTVSHQLRRGRELEIAAVEMI